MADKIRIIDKSSDFTLDVDELHGLNIFCINVDTTLGNVTASLPIASSVKIPIQLRNAGVNNLIIDPYGAETINGNPNHTITTQNGTVGIVSDGSNWFILYDGVNGGGGATALDDLTDVNAPTPVNNDVLTWNTATSKWINQVSGGGGMVYPGAGIALSTGIAWAASIADASADWNNIATWLVTPPDVSIFPNDVPYLSVETDPVFSAWLVATPPLFAEIDPLSVHLDQTVMQTILNGSPAFDSLNAQSLVFTNANKQLSTSGTVGIPRGGTGQTSKANAFNALSPMSTLGDLIYGNASGAGTRLPGVIPAVKYVLTQTGTGLVSAIPVWEVASSLVSSLETDPVWAAWLATAPNISSFTNDAGYLTAEADTLETVTGRGASTPTASTFEGNITLGKNGVGGTEGILTLRDGANPGSSATISYTKWADLEAVNGLVKCNGSGDYSAITDNSTAWDLAVTNSTKAKVSATDTTPKYMESICIAGANMTITKTGSPGDETLVFASSGGGGAHDLLSATHSDTDPTGLADGNIIQYDAVAVKWEPKDPATIFGSDSWQVDVLPNPGGIGYGTLIDLGAGAYQVAQSKYISGMIQVSVAGQIRQQGAGVNDYAETDPATGVITFVTDPAGDNIQIYYQYVGSTAGNAQTLGSKTLGTIESETDAKIAVAVAAESSQNNINLFEDFMGANITTNLIGILGWTVTLGAGTIAKAAGQASRPGIVALGTGTSASGRSLVWLGVTDILIGGGETIESDIYIPTLSAPAQEYIIKVGLGENHSPTFVNGIYFKYDRTVSVNWLYCTSKNTVTTETASGIAVVAGAWIRLKAVVNSDATSVEYFVDDVSLGAVTTNIPTGTGYECTGALEILKSAGTTERTFLCDFWRFRKTITGARS